MTSTRGSISSGKIFWPCILHIPESAAYAALLLSKNLRSKAEPPVMKNAELPAAFVVRDGEITLAVAAKDLNVCYTEEALMALCREKIEPLLH